MRYFLIFTLCAAGAGLQAQTPPKPPAQAAPAPPAGTTVSGPDGATYPLEFKPAPVIPPDRVVIQVGDTKLTNAQMDLIMQVFPESQRAYINGPGRAGFIDQVVRVLLLSEEGKRRQLEQTDAYKMQMMYSTAGILAGLADEQIKGKARSDESKLRAYFEAHKTEYEQVRARHILIRTQGSPIALAPGQKDLTDAEALAKIQEIREKIVKGADFADLARTESNDSVSAAKGGDLGVFRHGMTMPSFEDAAFSLPIGELSQPVKSTYGYHLIQVQERKPTKTFEELRHDLEKTLANEASRSFVDDLRSKTKVVIDPEFTVTGTMSIGTKK